MKSSFLYKLLITSTLTLCWGGLLTLSAQSGKRTVTGRVFDSEGEPLIGAAVLEAGTRNGAVTDVDGNFSISVPEGKTVSLQFSYIGMEEKTVAVTAGRASINVSLSSDTQLDAAVINAGYGLVQKKENLTGSAYQVSHDDIVSKPATRIDNLLAGTVPGLNVIEDTTNGKPSVKIRIRGDGSLSASSEPLWIIDGVPIYTGNKSNTVTGTSSSISPLTFVNPDDIESMTVLKDASMTALYGADGSNGVILVTTRSAKQGKNNYNASVKYGISAIDRSTTVKYCNAADWMDLAMEGWVNSGHNPAFFPYQDNEHNTYSTTDIDWFKVYVGVGNTTQINFSASGGSDKMGNFFSLSYYDNQTPYIGNHQQRYSVRNKSSLNFSDKLSLDANVAASYNHNDSFSLYTSYDEILPIFDPYNADGTYRFYNYYSTSDDKYEVVEKKFYANKLPEREFSDDYQNTLNVEASGILTYKPFKGMKITSLTGINFIATYNATYSPMNTLSGLSSEDKNGYSHRYGMFDRVINENLRANYNRTFAQKHALNAMAGIELTDKVHPTLNASGNGFINDQIKEIAYADASTVKGSSNTSHTRSLSYILYGQYTYDRRYTVTLSNRRQGYSSFSEYSRWGTFSSIGLNWNIKNEPFFHSKVIDILNCKFSYGNNGNSRVDTSSSFGAYTISSGNYYGGVPGANQSSVANPGLSWETTYITNVGVNIGIFNRFSLSLEYYNRLTTDLLYSGYVSSVITGDTVMRNVGEIENKGFEFEFNSTNIKTKDFTWSTSINGARNRNMVKKLYKDLHTGFFDSIWVAGAPKDAWWLIRWAGVDPTTGAPMWYDINGDLTYTFSYDNRVLLPKYSKQPDLYGGVSNDFTFKNFNLRVMFDYTIGGWDYFYFLDYGSDVINDNMPIEMKNHWRNPGDVSEHPAFIYKRGDSAGYNSTKCLYRMTSAQLRSVTFGYRLPKDFCRRLGMNSITVSAVGDNLYFWSPGQSRKHNSYKTLRFSDGMTRTISGQISFNF